MQLTYKCATALARLFNEDLDKNLFEEIKRIANSIQLIDKTGPQQKEVSLNLGKREEWLSIFHHTLANNHKNIKRRDTYPLVYIAKEYFDTMTNSPEKREKIHARFLEVLSLLNKDDNQKEVWYEKTHMEDVILYAMEKGAPAEYFRQLISHIPRSALNKLRDLAIDNSPVAAAVIFDVLEKDLNQERYIELVETALRTNEFNRLNSLLTESLLIKYKVDPAKRAEWITALIGAKDKSEKDAKAYDYALFVARLLSHNLDSEFSKLHVDPAWLKQAVMNDKFYTTSVLLHAGINPNYVFEQDQTVAHIAATTGREKLITLLNQFSADFNIRDAQGKHPTDLAKENNHKITETMIKTLINPPTIEEEEAETLITHLAIRGGGVKGHAYPYAIHEAEKLNLFKLAQLKGVAGASAGAITAGLIALNYSAEELQDIMDDLDFKRFFDFHNSATENELGTFNSIAENFGSGGFAIFSAIWQSVGRTVSYLRGSSIINDFDNKKGIAKGDVFLDWIDSRIKEQVSKAIDKGADYSPFLKRENWYELSLKSSNEDEENNFYVEYLNGALNYRVINPKGDKIAGTLSKKDYVELGIKLTAPLDLKQIKEILQPKFKEILTKTSDITGIPVGPSLVTFQDLRDLGFKDLRVVATDVNGSKTIRFSADETPNAIVADAIRASMSYPGMFSPHQYWIRDDKGQRVIHTDYKNVDLADGGIMDNFPVRAFDKKPGSNQTIYNEHVLGLYLATPDEKKKFEYGIMPLVQEFKNGFSYLGGVLNALISHQEHVHSESMDSPRTVYINTGDVGAMDLNLDSSKKEILAANGRQAIHDYISRRVGHKLMSKLSEQTVSLLIRLAGQHIQKIEPDRTVIHLDNLHLDPYQIVTLYANCKQDEIYRLQALVNPNNGRDAHGNSALHIALAAKAIIKSDPGHILHSQRETKIAQAVDRLELISANPNAKNAKGQTPKELVDVKEWGDLEDKIKSNEFLFSSTEEYTTHLRAKRIEQHEQAKNVYEAKLQARSQPVKKALQALKDHMEVLIDERKDYEPTHSQYKLKTMKIEAIRVLITLEESEQPMRAKELNKVNRDMISNGFFSRGAVLLEELEEAEEAEERHARVI